MPRIRPYKVRAPSTHDKELVNDIQEENPEVRKILKEPWEELDDDKEPCEEMSLNTQKKSPKKSPKKVQQKNVEKSLAKSPKVEGKYKKRAKTAWIHFFTDPDIRSTHTEKGKHLMKVLSEKWKGMSDDERQPWVDKHKTEKEDRDEDDEECNETDDSDEDDEECNETEDDSDEE